MLSSPKLPPFDPTTLAKLRSIGKTTKPSVPLSSVSSPSVLLTTSALFRLSVPYSISLFSLSVVIVKRRLPSIDPCGLPPLTASLGDMAFPTLACTCQFLRKE